MRWVRPDAVVRSESVHQPHCADEKNCLRFPAEENRLSKIKKMCSIPAVYTRAPFPFPFTQVGRNPHKTESYSESAAIIPLRFMRCTIGMVHTL